jgi:glyoxylase-like metal-dependent hydrolase (beta-lactamase superfamily II)
MIEKISLSLSNAYLIWAKHPILVDTGCPGESDKIIRFLAAKNLKVSDLGLIVHTHAHFDHCGSTAELLRTARVPTAVHQADAPFLRKGASQTIRPHRWLGHLAKPFLKRPYPAIEPDIVFQNLLSLTAFGLDADLRHTPGHTSGSSSVIFSDGNAIVGDLLMGSPFRKDKANYHIFVNDFAQNNHSLKTVLDLGATRFWVGHGGPLSAESVFRRIDCRCFYDH